MAYTIRHTINLGVGNDGKTLAAQLYNDAGQAVGDPITAGFTDRGNGVYWFGCSIPAAHGGYIDLVDTAAPTVVIDSVAINPQDAEYIASILEDTGTTLPASMVSLAGIVSAVPAAVWSVSTRTLSTFGTLAADIASAVWAATTRTLSAFGFTVATSKDAVIDAAAASAAAANAKLPVNTAALLARLDAPVSDAVCAGTGDIAVDHNTGGADELRCTVGGVGVDGVRIVAYLAADYDANHMTPRGEAITGSDGRWIAPMYLDADDYVLTFAHPGVYVTTTQRITVAES